MQSYAIIIITAYDCIITFYDQWKKHFDEETQSSDHAGRCKGSECIAEHCFTCLESNDIEGTDQ